jgi:hypothetical protein
MIYDILDYSITPIAGGPVQITLPTDGVISIRFVASHDQTQTLADYTGTRSVKASALLNSLSAARWKQILEFLVPILAAERAGLQDAPTNG